MSVVTEASNLDFFFLARNLTHVVHGSLIRRHLYFPAVEYNKSCVRVTQLSCYVEVTGCGWAIK